MPSLSSLAKHQTADILHKKGPNKHAIVVHGLQKSISEQKCLFISDDLRIWQISLTLASHSFSSLSCLLQRPPHTRPTQANLKIKKNTRPTQANLKIKKKHPPHTGQFKNLKKKYPPHTGQFKNKKKTPAPHRSI